MARLRFILLLVAFFALAPAQAQNFPAPNGTRVVDAAEILSPAQEQALDTKLQGYETTTGRQMVVATIPDLQGYPIEDYGYQLGRTWGIGAKGVNDGALLIVAPKDRKVRIEVGYGIEPMLTDLMSGVIVRDTILPHFKADDYPGGIDAGVDAMIAQLQLSPEEATKRAAQIAQTSKQKGEQVDIGAVIFWLFFFFFFLLPLIRGIFGKRGRRHGIGPVVIWGPGDWGGSSGGGSSWSSGGGSDWGGGGGFSGGGGSFGGGGASGSW